MLWADGDEMRGNETTFHEKWFGFARQIVSRDSRALFIQVGWVE